MRDVRSRDYQGAPPAMHAAQLVHKPESEEPVLVTVVGAEDEQKGIGEGIEMTRLLGSWSKRLQPVVSSRVDHACPLCVDEIVAQTHRPRPRGR